MVDDEIVVDFKKKYKCHEPWGQMTIYSDGTVSTCCATFGRNIPVGNIAQNSIQEIWNSKKINSIIIYYLTNPEPRFAITSFIS